MDLGIKMPPKLSKGLTKVNQNSEMIALAAAFLPYATGAIDPTTNLPRGLGGSPGFLYDRIMDWRFPDEITVQGIKDYLFKKPGAAAGEWVGKGYIPFRYGALATLAAMVAREFGLVKEGGNAFVKRIVTTAENLGPQMAIYAALAALVYVPAVAHASNPTIRQMITGTQDAPDSVKEVVATVIANRGAF